MWMVRIEGDDQVLNYFQSLPTNLQSVLMSKFRAAASETSQYIKSELLSGQLLGVKTGRLRNSIVGRVYSSKNKITLSIGSRGDVPYAAIYDKGGTIPAAIMYPKGRSVMRFERGGSMIYARVINHPAVHVQGRHYLETGVANKFGDFLSLIGAAIYDASRESLG